MKKRDKYFIVKVSEEEQRSIKELAYKSGMTASCLFRFLVAQEIIKRGKKND